jgi:hypothetical protein
VGNYFRVGLQSQERRIGARVDVISKKIFFFELSLKMFPSWLAILSFSNSPGIFLPFLKIDTTMPQVPT